MKTIILSLLITGSFASEWILPKEALSYHLLDNIVHKTQHSSILLSSEQNSNLVSKSDKEVLPYKYWKTHCSEKFRFEIQYPLGWISKLGAISDEDEGYQFSTLPENKPPEKRSYLSIFTTNEDMLIDISAIAEKKNIDFLGYDAISYLMNNGNERIVFKKNNIYFHVMIDDAIIENQAILDDILSSFRFLSDSEECTEINKPSIVVLKNDIYYHGKKIGTLNNGKIYISFLESIYSFVGNPKDLTKINFGNIDDIYYYKDLSINLPNKNREEVHIQYECTSSLLPSKPYFYCETNKENYLTQYEFGEDFRQLSSSGEFPFKWKKIYIKNIGGKDIVFEGVLEGDTYYSIDFPSQQEIDRIQSKEYLESIIQKNVNKEKEKIWEDMVRSFSEGTLKQ